MLYGCEMWGASALKRKTIVRALLSTQRRVLLKVNKAYRTVSSEACCVIAGMFPIDITIKEIIAINDDIRRGIDRNMLEDKSP